MRYTPGFRVMRGFVSAPSLFARPVRSYLFVSRQREELGADTASPFTAELTDLTAEQRFRIGQAIQISYNYNFGRNHTFEANIDPDDPFPFDLKVDIARLNTTAIIDTRDDLLSSTRGWFHSSSFEYAARKLGSDLRFAKYFLQQHYYRPLGSGFVLASAARVGLAAGFEQQLIPTERFFAGGGNSVRGYREDSLGPETVFGDPAGGNALLILNGELRLPIYRWVGGVAFVDAGNVFPTIGDLSFTDLRASTGFGVRVQTPFVLIRADFGMPLDRAPGQRRGRWFLSVGQAF
jgi:outer membrane protein assembly factor BamA